MSSSRTSASTLAALASAGELPARHSVRVDKAISNVNHTESSHVFAFGSDRLALVEQLIEERFVRLIQPLQTLVDLS